MRGNDCLPLPIQCPRNRDQSSAVLSLLTIVVRQVRRRWSFDTGDGPEVLVHRSKSRSVMLRKAYHGMICSRLPSNGDGRQFAVWSAEQGGMQVIEVHSSSEDLS